MLVSRLTWISSVLLIITTAALADDASKFSIKNPYDAALVQATPWQRDYARKNEDLESPLLEAHPVELRV
jgi:hypothetical protein